MILVDDVKLKIDYNYSDLEKYIEKTLKINKNIIKNIEIIKKSIDARRKPDIFYNLKLGVEFVDEKIENKFKNKKISLEYKKLCYEKINSKVRPIVVGFGPSGMFSALCFARMGLKPIVFEQGECVEKRIESVNNFWQNGKLNTFSNVQFGEGGAGTFSDGKLNTNLNNEYCKYVIDELYLHGAPKEITFINKPHIGSDNLTKIVKNIREEIISLGGEVNFDTKLVGITVNNNKVSKITLKNVISNQEFTKDCSHLVLCLGHSARDTFELLNNLGVKINQKPFAMGVRIEQKTSNVNLMQYGKCDISLPNADYKLVCHLPNGRSVFTFCMCPGGVVVASSSNQNEIVTNGMSYFARDNKFSNSALLVNVMPTDYESSNPLAGIYFQEKYEKLAYFLGGGNFSAPVQTVGSFLSNKENYGECSYLPKYKFVELKNCLPNFVYESLKQAIKDFNEKYKYFAKDDDVLIGIESRSSCPLTILRDENFCTNIEGIFPCGEGAGYAGGIVSSAQDGIKVAQKVYEQIKNNNF